MLDSNRLAKITRKFSSIIIYDKSFFYKDTKNNCNKSLINQKAELNRM